MLSKSTPCRLVVKMTAHAHSMFEKSFATTSDSKFYSGLDGKYLDCCAFFAWRPALCASQATQSVCVRKIKFRTHRNVSPLHNIVGLPFSGSTSTVFLTEPDQALFISKLQNGYKAEMSRFERHFTRGDVDLRRKMFSAEDRGDDAPSLPLRWNESDVRVEWNETHVKRDNETTSSDPESFSSCTC